MSKYVSLRDYAVHMGIEENDIVLISSDGRKMMWEAIQNKSNPDINEFIDGVVEAVGDGGTVIIPTYYWGFFEGKAFDYRNSPCETGTVGTMALKRSDFVRTRHPIYSFAVHGHYAEKLMSLDDDDCYGESSAFSFMKEKNVKEYFIDVSLENAFTYVHYVEQQIGANEYRFIKEFTADYIDGDGLRRPRTVKKLVPYIDKEVVVTIDPILPDLIEAGVGRKIQVNHSSIIEVELGDAFGVIAKDIRDNRSRKLCKYIGQ